MPPSDSARRKSKSFRQLKFEPLEERQMLAAITVTSLADNLNIDGQVTLREAILAAELDTNVDGSVAGNGADLIQFAAILSGAANLLLAGDVGVDLSALAITTDVTIRGNAAGITIQRSAIGPEMRLFRVAAGGSLRLESITVAGGFVRGALGALPNGAGGEARGGAIFNQGTLHIAASTIVGNEVRGGDGLGSGAGGGANGGAIYNDGGSVTVVNATISGNVAQSGSGSAMPQSFAGALYSRNGNVHLYNSTIANNTAGSARNVFVISEAGSATVAIFSSIIGQAEASPTVFDLIIGTEASGEVSVSGAGNIIRRQNDYEPITFSTADPLLGPLVNNGGPARTHALAENSPAIDQGSNRLSLATDQRGGSHLRVVSGRADIGAFEVQTSTGPPLPGDYNGNGVVDAADYVIWRKTLGTQVSRYAGADGNGNNSVDPDDFGIWRGNFGRTLDAGSARPTALAEPESGQLSLPAGAVSLRQASPESAERGALGRNEARSVVRRGQPVAQAPVGNQILTAIAASRSFKLLFESRLAVEAAEQGDGDSAANALSLVRSNRSLLESVWSEWRPALKYF